MAIIQSGATTDLLTVDPTSKAARVTLYGSDGFEANTPPTACYLAPINIRQTGASAGGSTVWSLRNGATKTIYLRRLEMTLTFDGTATAATTCKYEMERFSVASPTGGSTIPIVKKRNTYATSTVADIRFLDTGLTTTGITFENPFLVVGLPVSATGVSRNSDILFEYANENWAPLQLAFNEGICIRLNVAAVIGFGLSGQISWDER